MKKLIAATILATVSVALSAPAFAGVNWREGHQQNRILQGVGSGSINPGEFNRLENREHAIHVEEHFMRAFDGGGLTNFDRHVLNRQLNRTSGAIWRAKH